MNIWEQRKEGCVIMSVEGRLDAATAPLFEERVAPMIEAGDRNFLLDLAHLDYISSAAMRRLLVLAKRAEGQGGKVVLVAVPTPIQEILDLAGFRQLFEIYADQEEALQSFP